MINILTATRELGEALERYLIYVIGIKPEQVRLLCFDTSALSKEILDADFWIAEVWDPSDPQDPVGFRTLKILAGKVKCLLLFLFTPKGFPSEGHFWCRIPCSEFGRKIKKAMESKPPTAKDYQALIDLWPELGYDPSKHRHH